MLRIFLIVLLWSTSGVTHAAATIMVFGDSISSGYGLAQGAGWVDLLQQRLDREKYDYRVANVSVTGETAGNGKNRIRGALDRHHPSIVIVELGGNDGLRGASIDSIRSSLAAIIAESRARGARVLLVGMQLPPNYGTAYVEKFRALYSTLAASERVSLVPFIFEDFAAERTAFQADGIHPNAEAQPRMLMSVWQQLRTMLVRDHKR